ncbi:WD40 repeat domain-containing serine/threonine protein kinase [Stieleria neptunia]|nr:protein kinase [Stieleria neptunia]
MLHERIERLLRQHDEASGFLETPVLGLDPTLLPDASGDRAASLDAGLATAFSVNDAVLMGDANHSVLKMLGNTLDEVPRVSLRESEAVVEDPIARTKSPEMPDRDSGSRYRLDGEIARGGMGAILKGRDTDLGRDLAIKVLLDSHKHKPEVIQRFVEEAQIGGQLQHPGIAPVYELGQFADERPFFAMKLVKGQTLAKLLAKRVAADDERGKFIGIFEQICQTVAYAHSRGVIHRDLKPANIMVGAFGEVQVMDWGLAKVLASGGVADEKESRDKQQGQSIIQTKRSAGRDNPGSFASTGSDTAMGSVMGTPAYMPPEQALGEIDNMDERADVFALGAILCEILTGSPPYVGDDGNQVYRLASRGKLDECFIRLDVSASDTELIELAKRCLELEPADRPRDAGVLAGGITDYLESVETKLRESELERVADSTRQEEERKRRRVTLAFATSVLLMLSLAVGGWLDSERREARRQALIAHENAEHARAMEQIAEQRRRLLYNSDIGAAHLAWRDGHVGRVLELLTSHANDEDLHSFEWYYLWNLCNRSQTAHSKWFPGRPRRTALIPRAESRNAMIVLGCGDGFVRVVDLKTLEEIKVFRGPGSYWETLESGGPGWEHVSVAFSTATNVLAYANRDQTQVVLQEWPDGNPRPLQGDNAHFLDMAFSPDGSELAVVYEDEVRMYHVSTESWRTLSGPIDGFTSVAISPNGQRVAAGNEDGLVAIWNIDGSDRIELGRHDEAVISLAFSPNGRRLASGSRDDIARVWNLQDGTSQRLVGHRDEIRSVAFSPDGRILATGSRDNTARLWDAQGMPIDVFKGHSHNVESVEFLADGDSLKLITASSDRTIKVWDLASTAQNLLRVGAPVQDVLILPDGGTVVSRERHSGIVKRWDLSASGSETISRGSSVAANDEIVAIGKAGSIELWPSAWEKNPDVVRTANGGQITALTFSKHGQLAAGYEDGSILVWDSWRDKTATRIMGLKHSSVVTALSFSRDGKALASTGWDGVCLLHRTDDGMGRQLGNKANDGTMTVSFSPKGSFLAFGGFDNKVQLWRCASDIRRFVHIGELSGHSDGINKLVFSPEERTIITACDNNTLRVWDIRERQERISLVGHTSSVEGLAMRESGDLLISGSRDGTIRLWQAATNGRVRSSGWWQDHLKHEEVKR